MHRRPPLPALSLLVFLLSAGAAFADGSAVVGLWATEENKSHVEIVENDGVYGGTLVWINQPLYPEGDEMAGKPRIDRENPDPALRDRPLLGIPLMQGFTFDPPDEWKGGTIYDPESGKTYRCKMKPDGPDTLRVRGYVGIPALGRTTVWTRVEESE